MTLSDCRIFVVDSETDNKDAALALPVELAALEIVCIDGRLRRGPMVTTLVNPGRPIDPRATAIHGITDRMVQNAPPVAWALEWIAGHVPEDALVVAHHAEYDSVVISSLAQRAWVCTERLAHHLYPDAPSFKNDVLRYWLRLSPDTSGLPSHRAGTDAIVTASLFARELTDRAADGDVPGCTDVDELVRFAQAPYVWYRMPFGKHFDEPISKIPASYFRWALDGGMTDLSADMRYTFERELARRSAAA